MQNHHQNQNQKYQELEKKIIRKPKDNREFSNRRRGGKNNNRFSRGGRQGGRKEGGRRADGRGNKSKAE